MKIALNAKSPLNYNDNVILQSKTIDFLRFPLAVMVVFIHMNPKVINFPDADFSLWSWHGLYNLIGITFSHTLSNIAVPTFFLISGFLFFINIQDWDWTTYRIKIKKRVKTLIIPYVMWNLVPFILTILTMLMVVWLRDTSINNVLVFIKKHGPYIFYDYHVWGENRVNWLGEHLRMTGPYDLPLWFLRDLIVVTLCSPLIFWVVKRIKIWAISILFIAYISRIWPLIPGLNISAWFFFSIGAYFAIYKINIIQWVRKYAIIFLPLSIVLLTASIIYDGSNTIIGQQILPLYVCSGVPSIIYIASVCLSKFQIQPSKFLVSSCFFIYALHGVILPYIGVPLHYVSQKVGNLLLRITGESALSYPSQFVVYILSPFITILICLIVLSIGRRLFPRLTLLFSGNK